MSLFILYPCAHENRALIPNRGVGFSGHKLNSNLNCKMYLQRNINKLAIAIERKYILIN